MTGIQPAGNDKFKKAATSKGADGPTSRLSYQRNQNIYSDDEDDDFQK